MSRSYGSSRTYSRSRSRSRSRTPTGLPTVDSATSTTLYSTAPAGQSSSSTYTPGYSSIYSSSLNSDRWSAGTAGPSGYTSGGSTYGGTSTGGYSYTTTSGVVRPRVHLPGGSTGTYADDYPSRHGSSITSGSPYGDVPAPSGMTFRDDPGALYGRGFSSRSTPSNPILSINPSSEHTAQLLEGSRAPRETWPEPFRTVGTSFFLSGTRSGSGGYSSSSTTSGLGTGGYSGSGPGGYSGSGTTSGLGTGGYSSSSTTYGSITSTALPSTTYGSGIGGYSSSGTTYGSTTSTALPGDGYLSGGGGSGSSTSGSGTGGYTGSGTRYSSSGSRRY